MGSTLASPWRRDVFEEVPETLSSWDKCMEKSYCKYPVIVGIVVGSLVLIACIWCMVRCLACGAKCCCCGCGSKKNKPSKFADGPGFQPTGPPPPGPGPGPGPVQGFRPSPAPPVYDAPQFATFDSSSGGKVNEDSLPAMPSWDNATTRRVEDNTAPTQDVELGRLNSTGQSYNGGGAGAVPTGKPGRGGYSEVPSNPGSPVPGSRPVAGTGYRGTEPSPYINQGLPAAYRDGASPPPGQTYNYGYGSNTPNPGYGSNTPNPGYGSNTPNPGYGSNTPSPYQAYDNRIPSPSVYDNGSAYQGPSIASPPPPPQRIYSPETSYTPAPYQQTAPQQQYPPQSGYRMYSPTLPSQTPPPDYQSRMETPISMQAGRKPPPNTYRDV